MKNRKRETENANPANEVGRRTDRFCMPGFLFPVLHFFLSAAEGRARMQSRPARVQSTAARTTTLARRRGDQLEK